jgi:3-hydroxyacyl-CoA dehydrogenase
MAELVSYSVRDEVAVITIDNPPVNALGPGVPEGIETMIRRAAADEAVRAVVMIGAGSTFIAGADIREFKKIVSGEIPRLTLLPFLEVIEDSHKPVVIAIHGTAFGGGLETAIAGHYRVIAHGAQVGQPEVKLGLIPGAGGTQRLPRLTGVMKALEMCAGGEPVKAADAVKFGIADQLIEGDLLTGAIAFAKQAAEKPVVKTRDKNDKLRDGNAMLFEMAKEQARKKGRGMRAPIAAIEAIEAATKLDFREGCKREAELFDECLYSNESKALIHAFFGERAVAKIPGMPKDVNPLTIKTAAIVGAGTMGGGIAMTYANAGIPVIVKETSQEALDRGMNAIRNNYSATVAKGRLTQDAMEQRLKLITPQLNYDGFDQADIVTEAVFENMALKKQIFAELDKIAKPDCILASNTSSLDVDEIAAATKRPKSVVGTHFFSPANVMKLLEVVRGKETSMEVIAGAMALGKKLGKTAVLAGNCFGFIGNRMVAPYLREAYFLVEEGATVEQVNQALYDFGMAMGPLAMDDMAGIDVGYLVRKEAARFELPNVRKPLVADALYKLGRYGQKTGRGWSVYDSKRNASPDAEVEELIRKMAREAGIAQRKIDANEIVERCIYALVNEGARILEEGIALRAVDIDITYIYGYGFPAWRGGPMFYADTVGAGEVLNRVNEFKSRNGATLWSAAPLLERLAKEGGRFNEG